MKQGKTRLDAALVERGLCPSRANAQALIMAGEVRINGQAANKASMQVTDEDELTLKEKLRYVSRGGLKLEKALAVFPIEVEGAVCVDVGASTGGFTDCLLQNGAAHVYAVDVGHGQLAYALRNDARVTCMEKYNARNMKVEDIEPVDFACTDVSFISLTLILPPIYACMKENACAVALIKPQFEAGRAQIGKGGVVRDAKVHEQVCLQIMEFAQQLGFGVCGLEISPITGPKGNREFLLYVKKNGEALSQTSLCALAAAAARR
ncbi:MAG: TlyA family RNA methyltransferase [Christensenellales bacterium]